MPTVSGITRTDVDSLIETQVASEIFEGVVKESKALSLFRRTFLNIYAALYK